ncbi:uncharacterized protein [Nicotiana sylvestris]|uniref:Uncharacterized protein LOC104243562 isoform X2 n=1 Tax=Nicotiana sylvestris TaxID=4096 RepID=A0A1U7YCU8_NICSY|nr:PREDICTED: uncharacterized protein LOC104243562 isoform X2 [Nicotiana sylvestris]
MRTNNFAVAYISGIALWMNYYGFLGKRPRSNVRRLIKKYLVPLCFAEVHGAKEDYFGQLPDDVLISILAHLTVIDSMPTLEFEPLGRFGIDSWDHSCCPYDQQKSLKEQLLQLYSGRKVANVEMTFCCGKKFFREFDQWMHSISRLGVERLRLSFDCGTDHPIYNSNPIRNPNKLFKFSLELLSQASSLKHLYLYHCIIQPSSGVRLNSLRTLTLNGVLLASGQLESVFPLV